MDIFSAFEDYLNQKRLSSNTVSSYVRDIHKFGIYAKKHQIEIDSFTQDQIEDYIRVLHDEKQAVSSIKRMVASLKCFYTYLIEIGDIQQNPAKSIVTEKLEKRLPQILTNAEVELLLNQPQTTSAKGYRDKAMLELLYATGIRVTELIELNINDVFLELEIIKCRNGAKERVIPLYAAAVRALMDYMTKARRIMIDDINEPSLFVNVGGSRMTRQGFWKIIKQYKEKADIQKDITPHTLRHSFAAHLLENGAGLSSISEMLGHSSVASTQVYTKLIKSELRNDYKKFHPRA